MRGDNGASVLCLDKVGTSEVSLPNCHACVSASERYRPCLLAWRGERIRMCHVVSKRGEESETHSYTKTAFSPHLHNLEILSYWQNTPKYWSLTQAYNQANNHLEFFPERLEQGVCEFYWEKASWHKSRRPTRQVR